MAGNGVQVRLAQASDRLVLVRLAMTTFVQTYSAGNPAEDVNDYVAEAFSDDQVQTELNDLSTRLLLAEVNDVPIGYAKLVIGSEADGLWAKAPVELERIYLLAGNHGQGFGRGLLLACLDQARADGCDVLWLGVWDRNAKAIGFYEKMGFRRFGTHQFRLGSQVQTDVLFAIPVPSTPAPW